MAERDRPRCVEHDRPAQRRPPRRRPRAVDGERERHQRAGGDEVRGGRVEAAVWDSRMMRSPRFIDSESSVASEPLATVSTTAATDSPIPTQTRPLSRSPSSALAASATKIGDEVLMMPALSVVTQHDAGEVVAPAGRRGERRARGRDRQQQQRREDGAGQQDDEVAAVHRGPACRAGRCPGLTDGSALPHRGGPAGPNAAERRLLLLFLGGLLFLHRFTPFPSHAVGMLRTPRNRVKGKSQDVGGPSGTPRYIWGRHPAMSR